MSNWFDGLAKRSARTEASDGTGLTRRQVLARGAVVTGVAWTAPMLMAVRPAFAGASICTDPRFPAYDVCEDGTAKCCPAGQECVVNRQGANVCDVPPGGDCTNQGNGQCNGGRSRCDQPTNIKPFGTCGGPGTICFDDSSCQFDNCGPDGGDERCGGAGASCTSDAQCAPIDANNKIAFTCDEPSNTCVPV